MRVMTMDAELEFAVQANTTGKQLFDQVSPQFLLGLSNPVCQDLLRVALDPLVIALFFFARYIKGNHYRSDIFVVYICVQAFLSN